MGNQNKMKRLIRAFQTAIVLVCAVVVFGNGCAEGGFYPQGSEDVVSNLSASCKDPNEIEVIPGAKTASLVGTTNIVHHYSACTGLETISQLTQGVYEDKKSSIGTYGAVTSITAPYLMAVHSIAGEVCNDVIDQEIASGARIFAGWNLAANTVPSDSQLADAATNLSLSCWQDYEISAEEKSIIINSIVQSVGSGEAGASRKSAVMLCTSMLASLNALLN